MHRVYKELAYLLISFLFYQAPISCIPTGEGPFSIAAITWNMGNKTAPDGVVRDFITELRYHKFPDIIIVGTQEELTKNGDELRNKLVEALKSVGQEYSIPEFGQDGHLSSAGLHKTAKKIVTFGAQSLSVSQALKLPKQQNNIGILLKKGIEMAHEATRIVYPTEKQVNNSFIVIEGTVFKKGSTFLPISVASVHLNSFSDATRRSHANAFLTKQEHIPASLSYDDILSEAKRFQLVMGDFNERDYLMKDNSVTDRGRLTNLVGYGYDFSQAQERKSFVYGTYGFTKLNDKAVNNIEPEKGIRDPRNRKHNARGGFLDRIAITTGLSLVSDPQSYGALTDRRKFTDSSKTIFYAGSDHLPVMRFFIVKAPSHQQQDEEIVKRYIARRFPDFTPEIKEISQLSETLNPQSLIFYDSKESSEDFLKNLLNLQSLRKADVQRALKEKETELESLQQKIKDLETKIKSSNDPKFLATVYNKITECNKNRNLTLEKMGNDKELISWYFPNSLSHDNFEDYKNTAEALMGTLQPEAPSMAKQVPQKKGFFQKQGEKIDSRIDKAKTAAEKAKGVVKSVRGTLKGQ